MTVLDRTDVAPRPVRYGENSIRVLLPQTLVLTKRLLIRWGRNLPTIIETLIVPIVLLWAVNTVLGKQISNLTGHSALYGSVPMVAIVATISGSSVGAVALVRERAEGLLARFWSLPVHRASGLLARFASEAVRIFVTTLVILGAGMLLGFRFHQGVPAALAWLLVPVVFGLAFATLVTAAAFYSATTTLVEAISLVNTLGIFFCTGFVPLDQYPDWIQPVVEHQPMTYAVELMRGLSLGGPVRWPLIATLLWAGGIIAICLTPMVVGYRKASMR
ncbi:MAG: ABC transporter permease [Mycobacterium sp.]|nr:ABC transporter permease [Mycobacterium sp.]